MDRKPTRLGISFHWIYDLDHTTYTEMSLQIQLAFLSDSCTRARKIDNLIYDTPRTGPVLQSKEVQPAMNSSNAPYEIEYQVYPEYLHARVTAEHIDRTTSMSFLSDVLMECAKHRRKRLLLERGNAGNVAQEELFGMMHDLMTLHDDTKIAFLNRHILLAEKIRDVVAYGANLGGNYRCFDSFEIAEQWLLEDEG